jgi:trimethylamine--corrinoid protein Co-methyltransferase
VSEPSGELTREPDPSDAVVMAEGAYRSGVVVDPVQRLSNQQVLALHDASMAILQDPGILSFNERAVDLFSTAGCRTDRSPRDKAWIIRIPEAVIRRTLESAPSQVVLGAREPAHTLVVDASVPRVYFGTGAEANVVLEMSSSPTDAAASYTAERGSVRALADSARLCNALENVDFFIRNVNIQDEGIDTSNKDVNVVFASLMHMTKHVQVGLTNVASLDEVVRLAEILAAGSGAAPPLSFIACLVKSPLQMVEDTTEKAIAIADRGLPLVISSSPQGGSTGPVQEEGMVAMINAEILAGIALTQLLRPGTPVLYGAVPVRARLDTLHDLYGAPEFVHYNVDCVQMARHYGLPCYSSAGVGDASVPGLQATVEKVFSQLAVAQSGAQYIHYAVGLLDRTATFCPVQAVIDDANIGVIKEIVRRPAFEPAHITAAVEDVRKVMNSSTRLFARHIRKQIRRGVVSEPYPLEGENEHDEVLDRAAARLADIRSSPGVPLPESVIQQAYAEVASLLPRKNFAL